jgi:hypothetical protein
MNAETIGPRVSGGTAVPGRSAAAGLARVRHSGFLASGGGGASKFLKNVKIRDALAAIPPISNPISPIGALWRMGNRGAPLAGRAEISTDVDY